MTVMASGYASSSGSPASTSYRTDSPYQSAYGKATATASMAHPSVLHQPYTRSPPMHDSSPALMSGAISRSPAGNALSTAASAAALAGQKSRSVMACVLCRKQKMKCEGPEKAPCKRCRTAGVECTFEAPPPAAPRIRGQGAADAHVDARLAQFEDRINVLEDAASAPSSSAVARDGANARTDHERRIAALEAQVYALQISVTESQTRQQQQDRHIAALETGLQDVSQPQYAGFKQSPYGLQPLGAVSDTKSSLPPVNSTPFDSCFAVNGMKCEAASEHRDKRQKTVAQSDFIARGIVSEDEAQLCFESYFVTFPHPSGDPAANCSKEGNVAGTAARRDIRLPFRETRSRSPLLLATLISIGARSLSRFDTYKATLHEAIQLCHDTILCDPGHEPTSLDLKGMMLLSLYNGMPDLMSHGIALSYRFAMPTALLEYEALSDNERKSEKGRVLVRRGRTFFVAFLWTSFYSYCRGLHGFFHLPSDVIRHQLDLLEQSDFVQQPFDRGIRVNVEENLILRDVFDKIGPGMRTDRPSYDELFDIVENGIRELIAWEKRWIDMMELVTQWGDSRELKTAVPFHHGRQSLLMYIFRNMVIDDRARRYPKMREFAKMGSDSALVILRWGVESRIWLPHSMTAQYLHHVNIPTAINLLYTTSRLFPEDANFLLIRNLLQRLLKQCDICIGGNNGTQREVERAIETRNIVLEFDRFAFEVGGTLDDGTAAKDDAGLFGEEVTASLRAMGLELNLWGGILEGALDDVYAVVTST